MGIFSSEAITPFVISFINLERVESSSFSRGRIARIAGMGFRGHPKDPEVRHGCDHKVRRWPLPGALALYWLLCKVILQRETTAHAVRSQRIAQ